MTKRVSTLPWYRQAPKVVAAAASTGAACVSVLTFLYSFGIVGDSEARNGVGSFGVAWVRVLPTADTAESIGDTLVLAATVTDRAGTVLLNTRPSWTSDDPAIATVASDGSVIARGPGTTTITIAVGSVVARARIVVRQQVATVELAGASAGGNVVMSEGERRVVQARARDARGHVVQGQRVAWHTEDSTVARIDSAGSVAGELPGRTRISATIAGVTGHSAVHVVAAPAAVQIVAGDTQHVAAGSGLPEPVVVRVVSRRGVPIPGVPVRFRPVHGGAVQPTSALSDDQGRARTTWTLGDQPGPQLLHVTADGVDGASTVEAEAEPDAADTRVVPMNETLSAVVGSTIAEPVAIHVTDSAGHVLPGIPVRWLAIDGVVASLAPRTDSLGIARATWTLDDRAGRQRLQVQVGTGRGSAPVPPVAITATALPGSPRRLVVVSGDAQRGTAGAGLRKQVVIRVLDSLGNRVPGVALRLAADEGAAVDTSVHSDSTGQAAIRWTLGPMAGPQRLVARVSGMRDSVAVTATARAGAPARLVLAPSGAKPTSAGRELVATVTDSMGNPVSGADVRFTAVGGKASPARASTDAAGRVRVRWSPARTAATRRVTGAVASGGPEAAWVEPASAPVRQAGSARNAKPAPRRRG